MRRREISPEFWVDERVVEVSDGAKLLFIGLWNIADREGRLEDKARTIALKVRPWDPAPVVGLLEELVAQGMVRRYEVDGVRCLHIPRFAHHQHIHPKEMASKLPAPPDNVATQSQPSETTDAVKRLEVPRQDLERKRISPFPSGSSGSSFPSGSSGSSFPSGSSVIAPLFASPTSEPVESKPKPPRDSELLQYDFKLVTGSDYVWNGARDGVALAALLKAVSLDEVRTRWRRGLEAPVSAWASCRTVAQLRQKWNDLVPATVAGPPKSTRDDTGPVREVVHTRWPTS